MKLLFITHQHYLYPMEAHRVFRYLGDELQKRGHTVHYFFERGPTTPNDRRLPDMWQAVRIDPFISRISRRKQYDVLITPGSLGWCLGTFRRWQLPKHTKLFAWHGGHEELAAEAFLQHLPDASDKPSKQQRLLHWANRQALKTQDGCLVTSTLECEQLRERYAAEAHKIAYLPNGVSSQFYFPERYQQSGNYSISRLLMVGRWDAWRYGGPSIGRALAQLLEKHPQLTLSLINTQLPPERILADFPGQVHLAIHIQPEADENALVDAYRTHDLFLMPSLHESMPLSLLEAMASALPVVISQVNGLQTVITHYDNGLLIPPGDANALVQSISHLVENPVLCRQMGESAFETVSRYYTWRQIGDIFEEKLRQVVGQPVASTETSQGSSDELPLG
jgi:glycosyltransferase involved in cell wall biosynthesis